MFRTILPLCGVVAAAILPQAVGPRAPVALADPARYVVQKDDTLYTISDRLGVPVARLAEMNGLDDPSFIRIGQELVVEGKGDGRVALVEAAVSATNTPEATTPTTPPATPTAVPPTTVPATPTAAPPTPTPTAKPPTAVPASPTNPPPTATTVPPTPTVVPPTATAAPRTATPAPLTATPSSPTATAAPKEPTTTYIVQSGETMLAVSRKLNVPLQKLLDLNGISDPNKLTAGQVILVPAGTAETLGAVVTATSTMTATAKPAGSATTTRTATPNRTGTATGTPAPSGQKIPNAPAFDWPAQGPLSQYFGENGHGGLDIERPLGSAVRAAFDGTVVNSVKGTDGRGWYIDIAHAGGWVTEYQHLGKLVVNAGDKVKRGQTIGEVGMTGRSTGPHLHFELHKDDRRLNPLQYLP